MKFIFIWNTGDKDFDSFIAVSWFYFFSSLTLEASSVDQWKTTQIPDSLLLRIDA